MPTEDAWFQKALEQMHWLYSHELVEVDKIDKLTPDDWKHEGEVLVYDAVEDAVKLTPISHLRLNSTLYSMRGWCQSECQWSRLRTDVLGGGIPTPPDIFRRRIEEMVFTHRNDAEQVVALQEKVWLKALDVGGCFRYTVYLHIALSPAQGLLYKL